MEVKEDFITYSLNESKDGYTATVYFDCKSVVPESIVIKDEVNGVKVTSVIFDGFFENLVNVKTLQLPKGLLECELPFYSLRSLDHNPILDIVDLSELKPQKDIKEYSKVKEVGILNPSIDAYDYSEDIYKIEKVEGGYRVIFASNCYWGVIGSDRYKKESSSFVKASIEADRLFYYLAEQVKNNKFAYGNGKQSYCVENNLMLRSPSISIPQLAAIQYFFKEIIKENPKLVSKEQRTTKDFNAKEITSEARSEDYLEVVLPNCEIKHTQITLTVDFGRNEKEYIYSHLFVDNSNSEKTTTKKCIWNIKKDERIKELLLDYLKEASSFSESSPFTFKYKGKTYYFDKIKTSLYHLLQFISPVEFALDNKYLLDDGFGEYLYIGHEKKRIKAHEFEANNEIRIIRISDTLTGRNPRVGDIAIGDEAFKDCKNLEKVYISREFYAYRNEYKLEVGNNIFDGCDRLDGSLMLYPSDDDYMIIYNGHIERPTPLQIKVEKEEDLEALKHLPKHASVEVRCLPPFYDKAKALIENNSNIAKWNLGYIHDDDKPTKTKVTQPKSKGEKANNGDITDDDLPF